MAVINKMVEDVIEQNMLDYGAYIILNRAIPDLRDGFKPGQRRILYTMHVEKAVKFTKSANIEGAVMKIHPHGSTYGTMVNMVQKDRNLTPLIIGKGNFAQATSRDIQPGASRYTEIKLSEAAQEMLQGLNKNLVDFVPNYDGTLMMPEVLPVKYPVILTQPSNGVALGMASTIPSFNLGELTAAIGKYIKEGTKSLLIPDFATGGYIINNKEAFKKINIEGSGSIYLRGKAEIDGNEINITEIPYTTTREAIIDKIVELNKAKKLPEIVEVKDLTGLKGMRIYIRCKRGTDAKIVLEKLYQLTPLQSSFSTNLNVIVNKQPKVLGVWEVIEEWIKWRKETIVRGYKFDIDKMSKELHFLRGLEKVLLDIDEAIEIIRRAPADEIEPRLMEKFDIDEIQAKHVADMKLRNINKDYIINKLKDIVKLEETIADYNDIIVNDSRQNDLVIEGLNEVSSKYSTERKSKVIEVNMEKVKQVKKKIEEAPNFPVKLFITKQGYVKKMGLHAELEEQYVKPGDVIVNSFVTNNISELLVFGDDCCCYKLKISDIEESTNKTLGVFIPSLCEVTKIVGTSVLDDTHKFIIIGYDNNKINKVKLSSFSGNRKKLANSLAKNANVVGILTYKDEGKFIFKTTTTAFKIPTTKYDAKERYTQGVFGPRKGVLTQIRMTE
jgi:DNA gyrase subunit A